LRKKIAVRLLLLSLLASLWTAGTVSADTLPDQASTRVEVNWGTITDEATSLSYGLNGFVAFNPDTVTGTDYLRNLNYMKPGLFRYHSAEVMQDSSQPNGWIDTENRTWDADKVKRALEAFDYPAEIMMNIPNWPSWMDADGDNYLDADQVDDFAAFCAELVRIVNIEGGFKVKLWEPTNEWDGRYYVDLVQAGKPDRVAEWAHIYSEAAKAMKAVDPSILTGGPALARPDLFDGVRKFVRAALAEGGSVTVLDYLTYHFYGAGDSGIKDEALYDRTSNPSDPDANTLETTTEAMRAIVDEESPDRYIPIYLDEYNISWTWTNNDPRMHNHKGAVFDALAMIASLRAGADGTTAWNECDGVYGKMKAGCSELQPNAHVFQLLNNYFVGSMADAQSADKRKVEVLAVSGGDAHSLLLVNRSDEVQPVELASTGWTPESDIVQKHQISIAGYGAGSESWSRLTSGAFALPAHSVTVYTDSETRPSLSPPGIRDAEPAPAGVPAEPDEPGEPEQLTNLAGSVGDSASADYSNEGTLDWAVWGTEASNPTAAVRKSGANALISELEIVGGAQPEAYAQTWWGTHAASWNDGDPIPKADGSPSAVMVGGTNNGFRFTVPADTERKRLRIYLGVMGAKGVLTASLSDGSAPDYTTSYDDASPDVINNSGGARSRVVTLDYKAASPGQTLTVTYTMNYNHWGNTLWLQGATLSAPDSAMLRGRVENGSGANLTAEGSLDWAVWGTDPANPAAPVRKAGVPAQLSDLTLVNGPEVAAYTDSWWSPSEVSWSDGTPVAAADRSRAALVMSGTGKGVSFTAPADRTARTLKIYLGVMGAKGVLRASLSDGSAPDYVTSYHDSDPDVINNSGGASAKVVTLTYQAASPGQTLTVVYEMNYNHWGNVIWLQGAVLSGADTLPPAAPQSVTLLERTATTAALAWTPSVDNTGVTGYEIYRNGTFVGQTAGGTRSYYVQGLRPETAYAFTVVSLDAAGNRSAASAALAVRTEADTTAPVRPGSLTAAAGNDGSVSLAWKESYDNAGPVQYTILRDGEAIGDTAGLTWTDAAPSKGVDHVYRVRAVDAAGLTSDSRPQTVHIKVMTGIAADEPAYAMLEGQTRQLVVQAVYSDGSRETLNGGAVFSTGSAKTATVSATGLVQAHKKGTAAITVTYGEYRTTVAVTVEKDKKNNKNKLK